MAGALQKCFFETYICCIYEKNVNVQHKWMKYQYFGHKISIFEVRFLQQNIDIPGPYLDSEKQGLKQKKIDIPGYENIDFFESPTLRDLPRYLAGP